DEARRARRRLRRPPRRRRRERIGRDRGMPRADGLRPDRGPVGRPADVDRGTAGAHRVPAQLPEALRRRRARRGAQRSVDRRRLPRDPREPGHARSHDLAERGAVRHVRRRRPARGELPPARRLPAGDGRRRPRTNGGDDLPRRAADGPPRPDGADLARRSDGRCDLREGRATRLRVARDRLLHVDAASGRAGAKRDGAARDPRRRRRRLGSRWWSDRGRPGRRAGQRDLREDVMTFGHPWLLLTLLAVPAALLLYAFAQRRKVRYAVRFTNLEVLAPFVQRYAWRRYVPPALLALALASLSLGVARPHVKTLVP